MGCPLPQAGKGLRTAFPNPRWTSLPGLRHPHARQFDQAALAKFITGSRQFSLRLRMALLQRRFSKLYDRPESERIDIHKTVNCLETDTQFHCTVFVRLV